MGSMKDFAPQDGSSFMLIVAHAFGPFICNNRLHHKESKMSEDVTITVALEEPPDEWSRSRTIVLRFQSSFECAELRHSKDWTGYDVSWLFTNY